IATLILMVACVAFGTWQEGASLFGEFRSVAADMKDAAADQNFTFDDATVLFVRHTNQVEVADSSKHYWNNNVQKSLVILKKVEGEDYGDGQFELWAAHNGYVRLYGGLDWPEGQYEKLAEYLSKRFDTLVFEVSTEDSTTFHF